MNTDHGGIKPGEACRPLEGAIGGNPGGFPVTGAAPQVAQPGCYRMGCVVTGEHFLDSQLEVDAVFTSSPDSQRACSGCDRCWEAPAGSRQPAGMQQLQSLLGSPRGGPWAVKQRAGGLTGPGRTCLASLKVAVRPIWLTGNPSV